MSEEPEKPSVWVNVAAGVIVGLAVLGLVYIGITIGRFL